MTLLSLYTACTLLPLICLGVMIVWLLVKGRSEAMLCTECQSCITRCPARGKELNAFQIIRWAKTGDKSEPQYAALDTVCTRCGLCRKDCPRGLAPFSLLPDSGAKGKKPRAGQAEG